MRLRVRREHRRHARVEGEVGRARRRAAEALQLPGEGIDHPRCGTIALREYLTQLVDVGPAGQEGVGSGGLLQVQGGALQVGHHATSLLNQQVTGCYIPGLQARLPVCIQTTGRHISQIKRCGAAPAVAVDNLHATLHALLKHLDMLAPV